MPAWLTSGATDPFPQGPFIGAKVDYDSAVEFFQTGIGPGKMRMKGTRQREYHTTPLELTGRQLDLFNNWFTLILYNGTLSFTWTNMITGAAATYRFKEGTRPKFGLVSPAPNYVVAPDKVGGETQRHYTGTIALELMP